MVELVDTSDLGSDAFEAWEFESPQMYMDIKEIKSSYYDFSMVWKSYQVLREGLVVSKDEIDELIRYFEYTEDYGICDKLNKLKNER